MLIFFSKKQKITQLSKLVLTIVETSITTLILVVIFVVDLLFEGFVCFFASL